MARRRKERELRRSRITVIGEGLTERWYFDHLRTVMGYRYDCKPRFFTHQSYQEMRKLIDWVLQNDGIAVCICDADITLTNPEEKKRLDEMKKAYASEEGTRDGYHKCAGAGYDKEGQGVVKPAGEFAAEKSRDYGE